MAYILPPWASTLISEDEAAASGLTGPISAPAPQAGPTALRGTDGSVPVDDTTIARPPWWQPLAQGTAQVSPDVPAIPTVSAPAAPQMSPAVAVTPAPTVPTKPVVEMGPPRVVSPIETQRSDFMTGASPVATAAPVPVSTGTGGVLVGDPGVEPVPHADQPSWLPVGKIDSGSVLPFPPKGKDTSNTLIPSATGIWQAQMAKRATVLPGTEYHDQSLEDMFPPIPAPGANATPAEMQAYENGVMQRGYDLEAEKARRYSRDVLDATQKRADRERVNRDAELKHQEILDKADSDIQTSIDQQSKKEVDPTHWWTSGKTVGKIGMVIGAMLGGFLMARQQRGSNPFMDSVNQVIKDDIDSQKAAIQQGWNSIDAKRSLYAQNYKRFNDEEVASAVTTAQMYQSTIDMVNAQAGRFQAPEIENQRQVANIQLQHNRDAAITAAKEAQYKRYLDAQKLRVDGKAGFQSYDEWVKRGGDLAFGQNTGKGGSGGKISGSSLTDKNGDGHVDKRDLTDEQRRLVLYDNYGHPVSDPESGQLIMAENPGEAAKLRKGLASARQAREALMEYDRLRHSYEREMGGQSGWTEGARKMRAARSLAMKSVKDAWQLGAITESDYKLIDGAVPEIPGSFDGWISGIDHEALPRVIDDLDIGVDATVSGLGYSGSYSHDINGKVQIKPGNIAGPQTDQDRLQQLEKERESRRAPIGIPSAAERGETAKPHNIYVQVFNPKTRTSYTKDVPYNDDTINKIQHGAYSMSTPGQIKNYQLEQFGK